MVCVRIILLFVVLFACLASPALILWVDESKIYIVFCILADCKNAGHPWQDCYCCGNVYRKESCHPTLAECKAHCPLCNPSCSPSPPTVRKRP
ncbi:hypothetical protein SETIT_9G307700v2 [Setaria italica]|uniref:Embryo surrounding factor 1 brassicaceae domain-containing protein n=1 Tax=Setaria italica TaxID=4555 RepID=A0A368SMG1_SETIT|nr:hypothetical protein SETIT_9G307700v2 [Setaria italica]